MTAGSRRGRGGGRTGTQAVWEASRRTSAELVLERLSNSRPGAVEEHALVGFAQLEHPACLFGVPALDVAKDDHLTLPRRKLLDRGLHGVEQLASFKVLGG